MLEQPDIIWIKLKQMAFKLIGKPAIPSLPDLPDLVPLYYYYCLTAKDLSRMPIKTIIDVGANIGKFSRASGEVFPNAKVYAFEPVYEAYKLIKGESITAFNFALWDKDNQKNIFYVDESNTEYSSFFEGTEQMKRKDKIRKIRVLKRRFDKLGLKIKRPCYVKIDVEGAEGEVINGFGERLNEVDVLQMEWHFGDYYKDTVKLSNIIKILEEKGLDGFEQKAVLYDKNKMPYVCDLFFFRTQD